MLGNMYLLAVFSAILVLGDCLGIGRSNEESLDSLGSASRFREFLRQFPLVRNPTLKQSIPFELDDIFLKYSLGLAPGPTKAFDTKKLAGAYFKLFKIFKDPDVITAQFTKAVAVSVLRTRQTCVSGKVKKLIMVDIASMLQYDLRSVHQYIRPDLEALIPELRTTALDIGEEIPTLLDSLVIKHVLKPLARSLFPETFIKNIAKSFRDELVATDDATTPETFGSQIDTMLKDARTAGDVTICPKLDNIATALKTTLPKIPKEISANLVTIVMQLRKKLEMTGVDLEDGALEDLFDMVKYQMESTIGYLTDRYGKGSPGGIRDSLYSAFGIYLQRDLSEPPTGCDSLPVLLIREKINYLVGFEGALRDLFDQLEERPIMAPEGLQDL